MVCMFVIIYMQPDLFPLSRIYMYIYERIQPHFLWFTAFCGENIHPTLAGFLEKKTTCSTAGLKYGPVWLPFSACWPLPLLWDSCGSYISNTQRITYNSFQTTLPLLILSILMLLAGVGLSNINARGGRSCAAGQINRRRWSPRVAIVLWTLCVLVRQFLSSHPWLTQIKAISPTCARWSSALASISFTWRRCGSPCPAVTLCLLLAWLVGTGRLDVGHAINKIEKHSFLGIGKASLCSACWQAWFSGCCAATTPTRILFCSKAGTVKRLRPAASWPVLTRCGEAYLNFIFHKFFSRQFGFSINRSFQLFSGRMRGFL